METWHLWAVVALVLIIAEVFTPGFVLLCFGVGCLAAAAASFLGGGTGWQLLSFAAATLAGFVGARPLVLKYLHRDADRVKTNVDALAGQPARVTQAIDPATGAGRAQVGGDDWKAVSEDDAPIEAGARVIVARVEGAKVVVRRAENRNREG